MNSAVLPDPTRLKRVLAPFLDTALELDSADRSSWLEQLKGDDADCRAEVERLLSRQGDSTLGAKSTPALLRASCRREI